MKTNTQKEYANGMTSDGMAALLRLAARNHCTPGEMMKRIRASIRRTASTKTVRERDIGVGPASETEIQEATKRLAARYHCTTDEIITRIKASMRRVSRRQCAA